jgi:hypothetical protein
VEPTVSVYSRIGQVYESASPSLRARMLELLMHPLGVLSLMAVGNGAFAEIRFTQSFHRSPGGA